MLDGAFSREANEAKLVLSESLERNLLVFAHIQGVLIQSIAKLIKSLGINNWISVIISVGASVYHRFLIAAMAPSNSITTGFTGPNTGA